MTSDDAKNWATVAAIILAGLWAIIEFDLLSTQRRAADATSAAAILPRVNTEIAASVAVPFAIVEDLRSVCGNGASSVVKYLPTRLFLTVESAMDVSVRLEVTHVVLRYFLSDRGRSPFANGTQLASAMGRPIHFEVDRRDFGSLSNERQLDPGERNRLFFAAQIPFEVPCGAPDQENGAQWFEVAMGLSYELTTLSPVVRATETIEQASMLICRIDLESGRGCITDASGEVPQTPVGLARGLNQTWTDGGLLYSPPFR